MKFINRKKELLRLEKLANLSDGGVAVLWGRRRVGKTRLLLEWSQKYKSVYYTADESALHLQIKYFAIALESVFPGFSSVEYPDWNSLFSRLGKECLHEKWNGPLIIDELPYLISSSPELPSILQRFLDIEAKRAKLIVALCGSSQHMMQDAALNSSAPLYGRANEIIKLSPISIGYLSDALGIQNPRDIIESYAVWGGVPKYWELIKNVGGSLFECIDSLVLDPMGPLNDEPNRLLQQEIPSAISLRPILDAIGLGAHRLSEIATKVGQPSTSLTRPIQRLLELELVRKEIPFGSQENNSKKTLYKIKDPFLRFWFDLVASKRSFFAQTTSANRTKWLQNNIQYFFSNAWEDICRESIPFISQKWEKVFGNGYRFWQGQDSKEWDVLATTIDEDAILIGEAKWISKHPTKAWIEQTFSNLKAKGFPTVSRNSKATYYYVIFVPEVPQHLYKTLQLPSNMKIVDAAQIIHAFKD